MKFEIKAFLLWILHVGHISICHVYESTIWLWTYFNQATLALSSRLNLKVYVIRYHQTAYYFIGLILNLFCFKSTFICCLMVRKILILVRDLRQIKLTQLNETMS